ncbi:MAG: hypothetical protein K2W88_18725, partial [Pararheinheimera sp.]|nr:hypothetical protein [Rheinheimera sp.]
MIEVNVYEYLILLVLAVVGSISIGWPAGKWLGRQLVRTYVYLFGLDFTLKIDDSEPEKIRVRGKAGVKLADAAA